MKDSGSHVRRVTRVSCLCLALLATGGGASGAADVALPGAACSVPELHCPDQDCPAVLMSHRGNATDLATGRQFYLDYPCGLQAGEEVTFILNLHGGGSIGAWQRHYFPAFDFKDKYRLVVATPSGVVRAWMPENDDQHLQNIVNQVSAELGAAGVKIKAFWLAGHSQGGQTANRLLQAPFFRDRLVGWVSLSGGRLGSKRSEVRTPIPSAPGFPAAPRSGGGGPGADRPGPPGLVADASILPDYGFSHIYVTGEHELTGAGLPASSPWAEKLHCGARQRRPDVVDTKAGYVYDAREQPNPNPVWGFKARPGTAEVFVYPGCENGHLVADVVRLDKGHTEGLEPNVTEAIIQLMMSVGDRG